MKIKNKVVKFICCFNITLGARLIGFIGIVLSVALASVLLHDKSNNDHYASRRMAVILGLDWDHFHPSANATHEADPDGQMISIIVVFYSVLYMTISFCLIFATVLRNRWLALPWLFCELLGCLSRIVILIFYNISDTKQFNETFLISSIIYISIVISDVKYHNPQNYLLVITTWWWLVVFAAQMTWKRDDSKADSRYPLTSYLKADNSTLEPPSIIELKSNRKKTAKQDSSRDLCDTYIVSERYAQI